MEDISVFTSSKSNEWGTPQDLFDSLDEKYHFTLDPASTNENHKCDKYYTKEVDGLAQSWAGEVVFCNPPYGREIGAWVKKCYDEAMNGVKIVMLVPARTDTRWFHEYLYGKEDVGVRILFLRGRIRFVKDKDFKSEPAPFPSMLVFFNL